MTAPYYADDQVTLYHGDCIEWLRSDDYGYDWSLGYRETRMFADSTVDAVVTDPPYGIRFMGQAWDGADIEARTRRGREVSPMPAGVGGPQGGYRSRAAEAGRYDLSANAAFGEWVRDWSAECLRVLKPGGYLVTFGGSRTWHRLAAGIEDAGFEIRDSIAWLYAQGFPKSLNLPGGLGTALKPAFEPIVVARKPLCGTVVANVLEHGTGALNIDACRVEVHDHQLAAKYASVQNAGVRSNTIYGNDSRSREGSTPHESGRWPTNVVLDVEQAADLDQQSGNRPSGGSTGGTATNVGMRGNTYTRQRTEMPADTGGASRYFPVFRYEAKAPSSERPSAAGVAHPTVKPLDLMRWLVRLVTPPHGVVLEPFAGSGTTAEACVHEHMRCIAIERESAYLPLITARLTKPIEVGFDFTA